MEKYYECRFFTTKNCSPMGYTKFAIKEQAVEYFKEHCSNFMWAYLVEIDSDKNEKLIEGFEKSLDKMKTI